MRIERRQLVELLSGRNSDATARRVAQCLPKQVDLTRDRTLLRQCGIDPNVLAFLLYSRNGGDQVPCAQSS